jgi:hypothetical protein
MWRHVSTNQCNNDTFVIVTVVVSVVVNLLISRVRSCTVCVRGRIRCFFSCTLVDDGQCTLPHSCNDDFSSTLMQCPMSKLPLIVRVVFVGWTKRGVGETIECRCLSGSGARQQQRRERCQVCKMCNHLANTQCVIVITQCVFVKTHCVIKSVFIFPINLRTA